MAPRLPRRLLQCVAALALTALVTALFRHWGANAATVGFVYLLVVLAAASAFGFTEALLAAFASTAQYNYFFLPPVGTFTIQDPRNWVALFTFLATATVASQLSASARRRAADAEARRREVSRLYELTRASLLADPRDTALQLERALVSIFALEDAWIEIAGARPDQAAAFGSRTELRIGQRQLGTMHLRPAPTSTESTNAIAAIVAITLERARVAAEGARLEALRQSEALKSALLDSVTHDLRTPLTAIKAAVTAIEPADPTQRELLAVIHEESDHLNRILQSILDMARVEAGELHPRLSRQTLPPILDDAIARARIHPGRIRIAATDEIPELSLDPALISQAVAQLLLNASAYSPQDSPIELRADARDGELHIEVADHGPGIAAELLPRIFDKFYRDERARGLRPEGLGMGLAIARGMVAAHGGTLTVDSIPGRGACFTIRLRLPEHS